MSGVSRTDAGAPLPPPKSRKGRALSKGKSKKEAVRMSQYVDPQIINGPEASRHSRLDVIDQLDISGLTGASCMCLYWLTTVFHHDSPYDACSPQFNRGTRTAPVRAFDRSVDPLTKALLESHQQRQNAMPGTEDPSREQLHELSELSANQEDVMGSDPNAYTAEGELMGAGAEPWQEFHNSSPYQRKVVSASSSNEPREFGDMEAILRGGRRRAQHANTHAETLDISRGEDDMTAYRRDTGTELGRSKSLLGRFRRLKMNPEEAAKPDVPGRPLLAGPQTEGQITRLPQAQAPLSSSTAPTTHTLPMDSAGASAGQAAHGGLPLQPEATPTISRRNTTAATTSRRALNAPPPPPKETVVQKTAGVPPQRPSVAEGGAGEHCDKEADLPSRGSGLLRRFTLQRRRPAAR
ncbi:hypothetical protein MEQU1_001868 [Malassezia equina]|uniref:Uncharacterized protein n=1 Tax=Malassezia equina TaxID=1381935 RepID=A0AAF0EEJ8_9BASI|nr:hypothetical protein MEQU1_001868 [Malassezia equina]